MLPPREQQGDLEMSSFVREQGAARKLKAAASEKYEHRGSSKLAPAACCGGSVGDRVGETVGGQRPLPWPLRYLLAWFSVVGPAVGLQLPSEAWPEPNGLARG